MKRKLTALLAALCITAVLPVHAGAVDLPLTSRAAVLMEKTTGQMLFAQNEHEKLEPASVTKVMTLLLTMEAIDSGALSYDDAVTGSAHAASMGGSQIWLEPGEQFTLDEMIKAICVSSANDAAVAVAELVGGSEPGFVQMMNARAAELGNITRAAAELGYTQSAASHALRRLEQSLGTQLLQRLHMGVCLTENGRALLPYAAAMLTAQERLIQKAGELSDRVSGTVSVGCISSVAIRWLPELIEHMARRFPAVQIRFQDGSYEDVETWILKKKVDVGFLSAATKQPFRLTPLVEDELLLVLPHGHELCALEEVPPEQLRQQRVIVPAEGVDYDVGDILRRAGCTVTEGASVSSDYAALSLVGQARGVTILPRMLLADHDDRRVCLRYLAGRPTRTICLATLPQHRLSPAAETFCRCAAEMLCGEEAPPRS